MSHRATTVVVGQGSDGQLTLTVGSQLTYNSDPYQSRTFFIDEFEGYRVKFDFGPAGKVDELVFHQPNGMSVARRP